MKHTIYDTVFKQIIYKNDDYRIIGSPAVDINMKKLPTSQTIEILIDVFWSL